VPAEPSASRWVDAYYGSLRARDRLHAALAVALDGLWLGLLDREALAALDERHYSSLTERGGGAAFTYSDASYNRRGLQPWEAQAVQAHFPPGGRVVVTGAGGGREVLGLLDLGFDAVGFEPHPDLVRAGAAQLAHGGHPERLHVVARDTYPAGERADAVVVGWGSYMLMPSRARRVAFLGAVREHVDAGAPVLVSFFVREPGGRGYAWSARIARALRRGLGRPGEVEVGDALRPNFVHFFTRPELEAELAAAGFALTAFAGRPYGHAVAVAV
jgi:hypothetical protein